MEYSLLGNIHNYKSLCEICSIKIIKTLEWYLRHCSDKSIHIYWILVKVKLKQLSRMLLQRFYCWLWKRTYLLGNASKANFTSSEEVHHIIHNKSTKPPFPRFFVKPSTALEIHPPFSGVYHKGVGEMGEKGTGRDI